MTPIAEEIRKQLDEALKTRGRVNILVAGKTGVGKSTLINSVFGGEFAQTGHGRPITQGVKEISKRGVPLRIIDTRGLEQKEFAKTMTELRREIERRRVADDPHEHVHAAWLCLSEDSRRVEDSETELCEMLDELKVPTAAVITKSRQDNGFRDEVARLLPRTRGAVRVRALREVFDDGHTMEAMGLTELVDLTMELVPEGQHQAFAAAQGVSRELKKKQAKMAVGAAAVAAATAGATPIPFSDAVVLVPIQVGMLARITASFGVSLEQGLLMTLVSSAVGSTAGALGGRAVVTGLLKMVPGAGSIVGGTIAAATASALTTAIGLAYVQALDKLIAQNEPLTVESVTSAFKQEMADVGPLS